MLKYARSCGKYCLALTLLTFTACGGSIVGTPPVAPNPSPAVVASIYGANAPTGVGVLTVLSTGAIASSSTIPVAGLANPGTLLVGIAVDVAGEIFVTEQLTVGNLGTPSNPAPPTGAILVFAPGAGAGAVPTRTISGASTLLTTPQSLTVDAGGDLYVAQGSGDILEFSAGASGNVAPVRTVKGFFGKNTGVGFVLGMGVDPSGNLYLMNAGIGNSFDTILIFSPTQDGDVAPMSSIAGSATLLASDILGGSFDAAGNLYVVTGAEITPASTAILEFAAGASGNVAPIREIAGSNTMVSGSYVSNPVLDTAGNIYVMAFAPHSTPNILRFAPGANGNAMPSAVSPSGATINSFAIALH